MASRIQHCAPSASSLWLAGASILMTTARRRRRQYMKLREAIEPSS